MSENKSFLMDRATRFGIMIGLAVLMFVPLIFIALIVDQRAEYQEEARQEVGTQWGGRQTMTGPVVVIPIDRTVEERTKEDGETITTTKVVNGGHLILLPEVLTIEGDVKSETRSRGIFEVPVYSAALDVAFGFKVAGLEKVLSENETLRRDEARVELHLSNTRALRSAMVLKIGDRELGLEPGSALPNTSGVHAPIALGGDLSDMSLNFTLNGSERLWFAPVGRQTDITMKADWPHPSFTGGFLPNNREVSETGFTANWSIPHLARDISQIVKGASQFTALRSTQFGVDLFEPVNFYQKVSRATRYGILFIALTFLTVFLMEGVAKRPVHPAEMVLIGVAQCVFFLLLLSFAEQFGFTAAYGLASLATIGLLALYALYALRLGAKSWLLISVLVMLYVVLYLILQSTDYAMLAGSLLAFAAVALTMYMTRNEAWFGSGEAEKSET